MMYCLRTFLPLLLLPLPLSLSPIHLVTLLILTCILSRPCFYCSFLLIILFASSCHWSGRCFWSAPFTTDPSASLVSGGNATELDGSLSWLPYFLPRLYTAPTASVPSTNASTGDDLASFLCDLANSTISTLASSAATSAATSSNAVLAKYAPSISIPPTSTAGGIGTQWLRSLLGRDEWTVPCLDIKLVL